MNLSSIDGVLFAFRDANGNVTSLIAATSDSGYVIHPRIGGTGTSATDLSFRVSAIGGLVSTETIDVDGIRVVNISGTPVTTSVNASAIQGSGIDSTVTATPGMVLAWSGVNGWQASTITYPAIGGQGPSGYYAAASSLEGSAINESVIATPGMVLTWSGPNGWQASTITFPAGGTLSGYYATASAIGAGVGSSINSTVTATPGMVLTWSGPDGWQASTIVYGNAISRIAVQGVTLPGSDTTIIAGSPSGIFALSAGPGIAIHANDTSKRVSISGAPSGYYAAASSLEGSAINEGVIATPGMVLTWSGINGWQASTITYPTTTAPLSGYFAAASAIGYSALNQSVSATPGMILAWSGISGWQASTITYPTVTIPPSGYYAAASSLEGSAINEAVIATPGMVLTWSGPNGWQASTITYPTVAAAPPSGFYAAASSIGLSALNTVPIGAPGDVLAWQGVSGWQASTVILPTDFSRIGIQGKVLPDSDSTVSAGAPGGIFALSAGPNIAIHANDVNKRIGISGAPSGYYAAASSLEGSAINEAVVATPGMVLTWSGPNGWQASTIVFPAGGSPSGYFATASAIGGSPGSSINATVTATPGMVLTWSGATGWQASTIQYPVGGGGLNNVVEDPTPQLGGDLDTNGFRIFNASGGLLKITATDVSSRGFSGTNISGIDVSALRARATNASAVDVSARTMWTDTIRPGAEAGTNVAIQASSNAVCRLFLRKNNGEDMGLLLGTNGTLSFSAPTTMRCLTNFTVTGTGVEVQALSASIVNLRVGNPDVTIRESGMPIPGHFGEVMMTGDSTSGTTTDIYFSGGRFISNDPLSSTISFANGALAAFTINRDGYYRVESYGSVEVTAGTTVTLTIFHNETSALCIRTFAPATTIDPMPYAISLVERFFAGDNIQLARKSGTAHSLKHYSTFRVTHVGHP